MAFLNLFVFFLFGSDGYDDHIIWGE